jgi:hypothetical protein
VIGWAKFAWVIELGKAHRYEFAIAEEFPADSCLPGPGFPFRVMFWPTRKLAREALADIRTTFPRAVVMRGMVAFTPCTRPGYVRALAEAHHKELAR